MLIGGKIKDDSSLCHAATALYNHQAGGLKAEMRKAYLSQGIKVLRSCNSCIGFLFSALYLNVFSPGDPAKNSYVIKEKVTQICT